MRVFITGATGFIGSAVVKELIAAGHHVIGLCRSESKAKGLVAGGAEVFTGSVEDEARLKQGVARSDGVIHLAFNHDFSKFAANCADDGRVINVLATALGSSNRPLIVTSGTAIAHAPPGELSRETSATATSAMHPRALSEETARAAAASGVNVSVVRLPQVHDTTRQGLISPAIQAYRAKGECCYVGNGGNRWPAAHVLDVARVYRLAIEMAERNAVYHAVAEEGVPMRAVAETVAKRLALPVRSIAPEEAPAFFGWLGMFAALDMPSSSALTRSKLGWTPTGPTLLADLTNLQLTGD